MISPHLCRQPRSNQKCLTSQGTLEEGSRKFKSSSLRQPVRSLRDALWGDRRIILAASEGKADHRLAKELKVSRPTVALWRNRFRTAGVESLLRDATRPGRRKKLTAERIAAIVEATLKTKPRDATHWSVRAMARAQRISPFMVYRIWQMRGLKPHRVESFKLSTDPDFVAKMRDVVGLYLDPPDKALVLCVDDKSQIQALDRTQPILPLRSGLPERRTHDYTRHGTIALFAALDVLLGTVIGCCMERHRHLEFIRFLEKVDREKPKRLDIHLVLDNYGTHNIPRSRSGLPPNRAINSTSASTKVHRLTFVSKPAERDPKSDLAGRQ